MEKEIKTKKLWCPVCSKETIQVQNVRTKNWVCPHIVEADMKNKGYIL